MEFYPFVQADKGDAEDVEDVNRPNHSGGKVRLDWTGKQGKWIDHLTTGNDTTNTNGTG